MDVLNRRLAKAIPGRRPSTPLVQLAGPWVTMARFTAAATAVASSRPVQCTQAGPVANSAGLGRSRVASAPLPALDATGGNGCTGSRPVLAFGQAPV